MFLNFAINLITTFFLSLPLSLVFAAQPETTPAQESPDSIGHYNTALESLNNNKLGVAKGHIEQSLFLNPLGRTSKKLLSKIDEKLTDSIGAQKKESIPFYIRILDVLPSSVSYIFLITAVFLFLYALTKLRQIERKSFKNNPQLRLKTITIAFLLFCALILHLSKESSRSEGWACVKAPSTDLFTGPSTTDYVQTSSLPEGSCVRIVSKLKNWVALQPNHHAAGWAQVNDLIIVRSYKFDPQKNKD